MQHTEPQTFILGIVPFLSADVGTDTDFDAAAPGLPLPQTAPDFPEGIYALVRLLARQAAREEIATRCTEPGGEV